MNQPTVCHFGTYLLVNVQLREQQTVYFANFFCNFDTVGVVNTSLLHDTLH